MVILYKAFYENESGGNVSGSYCLKQNKLFIIGLCLQKNNKIKKWVALLY